MKTRKNSPLQLTIPEKSMSHDLYCDLYMLIDEQIRLARSQREAAADTLAKDISPRCVLAEDAIKDLKAATKRLRQMEALMTRLEIEVEEPKEDDTL